MKNKALVIADARLEQKIYYVRGKKVMFDADLAELYGVPTGRLNEAVKRNKSRFPVDFMFQLNVQEKKTWAPLINNGVNMRSQIATASGSNLRSQIAILKHGQHLKYRPYVFTEQGVAMLSSVLNSERAIQVNIAIMRTFTKIREMIATNKDLREKLEKLEKKYDGQFQEVFTAIKHLLAVHRKEPATISFHN